MPACPSRSRPVTAVHLHSRRLSWLRPFLALLLAACAWSLLESTALAQGAGIPFKRGPGHYFSMTKIYLVFQTFVMWIKMADWVNRDAHLRKMKWAPWNFAVFGSFLFAFGVMMAIPSIYAFYVTFPLLLVATFVPTLAYCSARNKKVEPHEMVLTGDHLWFVFATFMNKSFKMKLDPERKTKEELGPPVKLVAQGAANEQTDNVNLLTARQSPAFELLREMIFDAVGRRVDQMMFDYSATSVNIKYQIDGLWMDMPPRDRESGDAILAVMKILSALNPQDRVNRQSGKFLAEVEKKRKLTFALTAQGVPTGEMAHIVISEGKAKILPLLELGMRDKMVDQLKAKLNSPQGLVIFSSPPLHGLTTTFNASLQEADRFTRPWVAIEPLGNAEREIENIPITTYNQAGGEKPDTVLPKLIRTYPEAYVIRDMVNGETLNLLVDEVLNKKRLVVTSVRAKDACEAILRLMQLKPDAARFAESVTAVVNQRLLRKLCECKLPYEPPPQMLMQLRIPQGRVQAFYQPPQVPEDPKLICRICGGIGYFGRTAVYEYIEINDAMREILANKPRLDALRMEARKAGFFGLQDEGIVMCARGVTSVQELMRVLAE